MPNLVICLTILRFALFGPRDPPIIIDVRNRLHFFGAACICNANIFIVMKIQTKIKTVTIHVVRAIVIPSVLNARLPPLLVYYCH